MKTICVFCGSYNGADEEYVETAQALGTAIARRGLGLVYGGGHVGLMGTVADAVLAGGGHVIGVMPQALVEKELQHKGVQEFHTVATMHERKALMAERADAFIALPGGFGTMDELFEIVTWAQLGLHRKPIVLLNVAGYFKPLLHLFHHMAEEGFIKHAHRSIILVEEKAEQAVETALTAEPPSIHKWITPEDL